MRRRALEKRLIADLRPLLMAQTLVKVIINAHLTRARFGEVGRLLDTSKGAEIIDVADKTVMPGLVDVHSHICSNSYPKSDIKIQNDKSKIYLMMKAGVRGQQGV